MKSPVAKRGTVQSCQGINTVVDKATEVAFPSPDGNSEGDVITNMWRLPGEIALESWVSTRILRDEESNLLLGPKFRHWNQSA